MTSHNSNGQVVLQAPWGPGSRAARACVSAATYRPRLPSRNQGRADDNIETIKKRFKVFLEQSLPVIAHYGVLGKVRKIDTDRPVDVIYAEVRSYVAELGNQAN